MGVENHASPLKDLFLRTASIWQINVHIFSKVNILDECLYLGYNGITNETVNNTNNVYPKGGFLNIKIK